MLVAWIQTSQDGENPSFRINPEAGWTEIVDVNVSAGSAVGLYVAWHIATSDDEILSNNFNAQDDTGYVGTGMVFRGVDPTTPIDVQATGATQPNALSNTTPSVTTTVPNVFVVRTIALDDNLAVPTTPSPGGYAHRITIQAGAPGNGVTGFLYDMVEPSAGATGTEVISWTVDSEENRSFVFGLRPEPIIEEFTVDAILKAVQTETFTIDAFVGVKTFNFTVNALLKATQTKVFTIDALLQILGQTEVFTVDSILILIKEFTIDAVLKASGDNGNCGATVQSGTVSFTGTTTDVTLPNAVVLADSFLTFQYNVDNPDVAQVVVRGQLTTTTNIHFERTTGGATVDLSWYVTEYPSFVSSQRGSLTMTATTNNQTITSVDTAKSFSLASWEVAGASWGDGDTIRHRLTTATNLEFLIDTLPGGFEPTIDWEVVEFTDAVVQRGITTFAAGTASENIAITSVDLSRSIVHLSNTINGAIAITPNIQGLSGELTTSTNLHIERDATGNSMQIAWEVTEFPVNVKVQTGTESLGTAQTVANVAINSVDTSKTAVLISHDMRGGRTNDAIDDNPHTIWYKAELTTATNLQLTRAASASSTGDVVWYVIEFSPKQNACASIDAILVMAKQFTVDATLSGPETKTFAVDAFIQATGDNGNCGAVVQRGMATIGSGATSTDVTITAVTLSDTALFWQYNVDNSAPTGILVRGQLSSTTNIHFERDGTPTDVVNISYYVVEYPERISSQRGNVVMTALTTNVTIASTDMAESFQTAGWENTGTDWGDNDEVRHQLTSATNLEFLVDVLPATFEPDIDWEVIEFRGARVIRGLVSFAAGQSSDDIVIPEVDLTRCITHISHSINGFTGNPAVHGITAQATTSTNLHIQRDGTGNALEIAWYIVEFPKNVRVQSGSESLGTSQTVANVALTAVDLRNSAVFLSHNVKGGRTNDTVDDNPHTIWYTGELTSRTNLQLTRAASDTSTGDVVWHIIQFGPEQNSCLEIDAILAGTEEFAVDALLQQEQTETFTIDAILQKEQVFNFTVDGLIQATPEEMFLIDALLQETFTEDFEVNSIVVDRNTETFTVNSILVNRNIETFTIDSLLQVTQTETFTIDALLQLTDVKEFELDSILKATFTKDFTVDGCVQDIMMFFFTVDSILAGTEEFAIDAKLNKQTQITIDARLAGIEEFTIDAELRPIQEFTIDSIIVDRNTETFDIDAFLQAEQVFNFTVDGLKQATPEKLFLIDAFLQDTFIEDFEVDSFIQDTFTNDFTIDSILAGTEPFTVDAKIVRIERFSIDAQLRPIREFIIDAKLNRQVQVDVDAIVVDRNTEVFDIDAFLQDTFTEDFLVDAFPQAEQTFNFTVDGLPQDQFTELFLIDAILRATFIEDFTVDAKVIVRRIIEFTVDSQFEPQKLFCDFFNRPDNIALGASDIPGNTWIESEAVPGVGAEIVSNKMEWLSVQNSNNTNEPVITNNFTKQTSGKLKWQFQFDFDNGADLDYRLTMQLGDGALFVDPNTSHTTGVAVNFQYISQNRGMTNNDAVGHGFEPSPVEIGRVSGLITVDITADFGTQTYNINLRGTGLLAGPNLTTGIPFVNSVGIDTIRIYSDLLSAIAFTSKKFDDMCVFNVFETTESFSIDAVLKETKVKQFIVDSLTQETFTETFSLDGLRSAEPDKFFLIDVFLQKENTEETEIDVILSSRIPFNYTVDSILKAIQIKDFTVDSCLRQEQAEVFTVDVLLAEIKTKDFTVDGFLAETPIFEFTVDAFPEQEQTLNFTVDSFVFEDNVENFLVNSLVKALGQVELFEVGAKTKATQTENFTIDALVKKLGQTFDFTVDSQLAEDKTKPFLINSLLEALQTKTFDIDAKIALQNTVDFTVDGRIAVTRIFKVDALITLVKQFTVGTKLQGTQTKDFIVDGLTFIPPAILICLDAKLIVRNTKTFTIDTFNQGLNTKPFSIDAVIEAIQTKDFTVDAQLNEAATQAFTVDANIVGQPTKNFTVDSRVFVSGEDQTISLIVDAKLSLSRLTGFNNDALLKALGQTFGFTVDARLQTPNTVLFTLDAVFPRQQFNNRTVDALLQELGRTFEFTLGARTLGIQTETFSVDAILRAEFTTNFRVDGISFIPPAVVICVGPIIQFTAVEGIEIDSKLIVRKDTSFSIDAVLAVTVTNTKDFEVDSQIIQLFNAKNFTIDSIMFIPKTRIYLLDAILKRRSTRSFLIDATELHFINTEDFDVDAIFEGATLSTTFSIDSDLVATQTELVDINALIATRNTTIFIVDSIPFIPPAATFLVHGFAKAFNQTEDFTLEAHLRLVQSETLDVDSVLQEVQIETFTIDALLRDTFTKVITTDAKLVRTNIFSIDSLIQRLGTNCRAGVLLPDDFSSDSGWLLTSTGNSVEINSTIPGEVFYNEFGNFVNGRYYKDLDFSGGLSTINTLEDFRIEFKYNRDSIALSGLNGPHLMGLTNVGGIMTSQQFFGVQANRTSLTLEMRDLITSIKTTTPITIPNDVDLYIRAEKTGNFMRLSVTTDPLFQVHLANSPTPFINVAALQEMTFDRVGGSSTGSGTNVFIENGRLDDLFVFADLCTDFMIDAQIQNFPGKSFTVDSRLTERIKFDVDAVLKAIGANRCPEENIFEELFTTVNTWSNEINNFTGEGWGDQRIFINGESASSEELLDPSDNASLNGFSRIEMQPGGFGLGDTPIFKTKFRRKLLSDNGGIGKIRGSKFRVEFEFEQFVRGQGKPVAFNASGNHVDDDNGPQFVITQSSGGTTVTLRDTAGISVSSTNLQWTPSSELSGQLFVVAEVDGTNMTYTYFNDAEHTSINAGPLVTDISILDTEQLDLEWFILGSNPKGAGPANSTGVVEVDNVKIFSSPCPVLYIDANLQRKPIKEFTVDAKLVKIQEFSIDAKIRPFKQFTIDVRLVNVAKFFTDARLSMPATIDFTIDPITVGAQTEEFALDAVIVTARSFSINAIFSTIPQPLNFSLVHMQDITPMFGGIFTSSFRIDAVLRGRIDFTLDANVTMLARAEVDAFLTTEPQDLNFSLVHMQDITALFNNTVTEIFQVDVLLSTTNLRTFTVDALQFFGNAETFDIDSILVQSFKIKTFDMDTLLEAENTQDVFVDSRVIAKNQEDFFIDTFSIGEFQRTVQIEALLQAEGILKTFSIDARILQTQTFDITADARLLLSGDNGVCNIFPGTTTFGTGLEQFTGPIVPSHERNVDLLIGQEFILDNEQVRKVRVLLRATDNPNTITGNSIIDSRVWSDVVVGNNSGEIQEAVSVNSINAFEFANDPLPPDLPPGVWTEVIFNYDPLTSPFLTGTHVIGIFHNVGAGVDDPEGVGVARPVISNSNVIPGEALFRRGVNTGFGSGDAWQRLLMPNQDMVIEIETVRGNDIIQGISKRCPVIDAIIEGPPSERFEVDAILDDAEMFEFLADAFIQRIGINSICTPAPEQSEKNEITLMNTLDENTRTGITFTEVDRRFHTFIQGDGLNGQEWDDLEFTKPTQVDIFVGLGGGTENTEGEESGTAEVVFLTRDNSPLVAEDIKYNFDGTEESIPSVNTFRGNLFTKEESIALETVDSDDFTFIADNDDVREQAVRTKFTFDPDLTPFVSGKAFIGSRLITTFGQIPFNCFFIGPTYVCEWSSGGFHVGFRRSVATPGGDPFNGLGFLTRQIKFQRQHDPAEGATSNQFRTAFLPTFGSFPTEAPPSHYDWEAKILGVKQSEGIQPISTGSATCLAIDACIDGLGTKERFTIGAILDQGVAEFGVDSITFLAPGKSYVLDSILLGDQQEIFSISSILNITKIAPKFNIRAILQLQGETETFSMDAILNFQGETEVFRIDGIRIIGPSRLSLLDANVKAFGQVLFPRADAILFVEQAETFETDAIIISPPFQQGKFYTINARVTDLNINVETFDITATLATLATQDFTIDGLILKDDHRFRVSSILRKTQQAFIFPDALLSNTFTTTTKPDGLIEGLQNKPFTIDGIRKLTSVKLFLIDAQTAERNEVGFTVDCRLQGATPEDFFIDSILGRVSPLSIDSILQALGDGDVGTGNNGSTNPFAVDPIVEQTTGGLFFGLPLGTLVGQRLRLVTAPVRITSFTVTMFRDGNSGSPVGTLTGKVYKNSVAGTPIVVGDLIATSDNIINVADLTTNNAGQLVTFTFTNPDEVTVDDNVFIGFDINGSNEQTFIETEATGTVIPGGDLNVEFVAGTWGADLGVDLKITINIDNTPRQRASSLMSAFVGRFIKEFTVDAILVGILTSNTETFLIDSRVTGPAIKGFTVDANLRGRSFAVSAFVGDVFEVILDVESVIAGNRVTTGFESVVGN